MKTPGQVAFERWYKLSPHMIWLHSSSPELWEKTAQAVLDSQWRSVDDPPEDKNEVVLVCGGFNSKPETCHFHLRNHDRTHWMRIPKMPQKSKDREEFEEWAKKYFTNTEEKRRQDIAWQAWQAAKATK